MQHLNKNTINELSLNYWDKNVLKLSTEDIIHISLKNKNLLVNRRKSILETEVKNEIIFTQHHNVSIGEVLSYFTEPTDIKEKESLDNLKLQKDFSADFTSHKNKYNGFTLCCELRLKDNHNIHDDLNYNDFVNTEFSDKVLEKINPEVLELDKDSKIDFYIKKHQQGGYPVAIIFTIKYIIKTLLNLNSKIEISDRSIRVYMQTKPIMNNLEKLFGKKKARKEKQFILANCREDYICIKLDEYLKYTNWLVLQVGTFDLFNQSVQIRYKTES